MKLWAVALLAMLGASLPGAGFAHPHAWIDLVVHVRFDAEGRVTALHEEWLFDEYYTAFALEALGKSPEDELTPDDMRILVEQSMESLRDYRYFTRISVGTKDLDTAKAEDALGVMQDGRWKMAFTLPLATPRAPGKQGIAYAIYDPSYYVEMLHLEGAGAVVLEQAPESCSFRKTRPEPNFEALSLAAAADMERTDGTATLGALFAEKVTIRCG